jgi:AraC-like DNA-binding protein
MDKQTVWIEPGIVSIYGASFDAAPHIHQAIQIIWPKSALLCSVNENQITLPVIINSKVPHRLKMTAGWVLLIEPKSDLGESLSHMLNNQAYKLFDFPFISSCDLDDITHGFNTVLAPLFSHLNLPNSLLIQNNTTVIDKRIKKIIAQLDKCLEDDCIKPKTWRASEVANQLCLSESRFLHLFSQELGISWRPYLLWRRMMCAVQAILNNTSATDAAHLAGFSDSAHLSRTFKNTFGMTIRQALTLFKR